MNLVSSDFRRSSGMHACLRTLGGSTEPYACVLMPVEIYRTVPGNSAFELGLVHKHSFLIPAGYGWAYTRNASKFCAPSLLSTPCFLFSVLLSDRHVRVDAYDCPIR